MENSTFYINASHQDDYFTYNEIEDLHVIAYIFIAILVVTAVIAMIVNVVVFISVYWIRKPMPPVLRMSISLAAADALSSSIFALTLYINTYLPYRGINL